ncbi:MAG TPA: hypothetical protein VFZ91_08000 [Allosphingosinicella sp.]
MNIIEILLPVRDNAGNRFGPASFAKVREELLEHFGGLTAFTRSPAEGLWESAEGECDRDEIIIFEVMADWIDRSWWRAYRVSLEHRFRQVEIVIRAWEMERL